MRGPSVLHMSPPSQPPSLAPNNNQNCHPLFSRMACQCVCQWKPCQQKVHQLKPSFVSWFQAFKLTLALDPTLESMSRAIPEPSREPSPLPMTLEPTMIPNESSAIQITLSPTSGLPTLGPRIPCHGEVLRGQLFSLTNIGDDQNERL